MNGEASPYVMSELSTQAAKAQITLEQTRRDLVDFLNGDPVRTSASSASTSQKNAAGRRDSVNTGEARASTSSNRGSSPSGIDWVGLVKAGVATWWRDHPAHLAATILEPVAADYVRRKPLPTLAIAAAAGAALVLIRPWRIASVTALGLTLVRSSNVPGMAASLVATVAEKLQKEQS